MNAENCKQIEWKKAPGESREAWLHGVRLTDTRIAVIGKLNVELIDMNQIVRVNLEIRVEYDEQWYIEKCDKAAFTAVQVLKSREAALLVGATRKD